MALKADIDPDALESLHRTTSRPFDHPETGKIAVEVINDYGDEVMKVFKCDPDTRWLSRSQHCGRLSSVYCERFTFTFASPTWRHNCVRTIPQGL